MCSVMCAGGGSWGTSARFHQPHRPRPSRLLHPLPRSVVAACWAKCVPKPREDQLSIGEMSCIDRCTAKYLETQALVRTELEAARNKAPIPYP